MASTESPSYYQYQSCGEVASCRGGYNGNVEGYAKVAKDLGGDADKGFEQVLNEQTAGAMLAAGALLGAKKGGAASIKQIDNLKAASTKKFKVVEIKAGEKGSWNKPLNKPSPNTIYNCEMTFDLEKMKLSIEFEYDSQES